MWRGEEVKMGGCGADSSGSDWGGVVGRWIVSKNNFSAL